jgi:hypothetical protein
LDLAQAMKKICQVDGIFKILSVFYTSEDENEKLELSNILLSLSKESNVLFSQISLDQLFSLTEREAKYMMIKMRIKAHRILFLLFLLFS